MLLLVLGEFDAVRRASSLVVNFEERVKGAHLNGDMYLKLQVESAIGCIARRH